MAVEGRGAVFYFLKVDHRQKASSSSFRTVSIVSMAAGWARQLPEPLPPSRRASAYMRERNEPQVLADRYQQAAAVFGQVEVEKLVYLPGH